MYFLPERSTVFSGVSNMMFTFGVKNVLPEMTRELRDPVEMHKSWTAANVVAMPVPPRDLERHNLGNTTAVSVAWLNELYGVTLRPLLAAEKRQVD